MRHAREPTSDPPLGQERRSPRRPTGRAAGRPPRDPGREVLEGLLGGFAVALLVCVAAFASTSWLSA
jgi:hypothetical protein